jgi:Holliday junction resolvasome RuvABC endonuclease subunit
VIVGGLDLSLRSTGMAKANTSGGFVVTRCVTTGQRRGHERLEYLLAVVVPWLVGRRAGPRNQVGHIRCDLVVIEGLPMHMQGSASILDLAGLGGLVRHELWRAGVPYVLINPTTLKLYATGNAKADKVAMVAAAYRAMPPAATITNDDVADAMWLLDAGCRHYGHPLCQLPDRQAAYLTAVAKKGRRKGQPVIAWPALGVLPQVQGALPGFTPVRVSAGGTTGAEWPLP